MKMPRIVLILILGILLVRMALFMSYPFLALHLEQMNYEAIDIGIILGCHYFFAGVTGVFGGNIADRSNPKLAIVIVLMIGAGAFLGLSQAEGFSSFLLLNCLLAISISSFEPIASMLITTNVHQDFHSLAFRYRYMAINVGAAIGPLFGVILIAQGSQFSFLTTCLLLVFYATVFSFVKIEKGHASDSIKERGKNLREVFIHMKDNTPFLYLILANLFVTMTYGQIFSTLPQILNAQVENGKSLYSILLTVNPITVILTGVFFTNFISKQSSHILFTVGSTLLAISFLGFHFFSTTEINYVFFMILFTLAEIALIPTTSKVLFDLAPIEFRGAYLGSESTSYLGFFIGNLVGGWLLQHGYGVFIFCVCCAGIGLVLYQLALKSLKDTKSEVHFFA